MIYCVSALRRGRVSRLSNQLEVGESAYSYLRLAEGALILGEWRCWYWRRVCGIRGCGLEGGS